MYAQVNLFCFVTKHSFYRHKLTTAFGNRSENNIDILLTAIGLTPGGSSTVQYSIQLHTQYTEQHNETEYTERNIHNNNNTQFTKLNRSTQNTQPYIQ